MMIASALNTPADWLRAGNVVQTIDDYASAHHGYAPVLVFVDATGAFDNDTECVNGNRGNAADHLIKDVVPFMISNFAVSEKRSDWGVVGWSMGGTCAVDLTVMHPDLFSAFVDIAGDLEPNTGTKDQTIARLFGGNADEWAAYDPTTVMTRHGPYTGVWGWFDIPGNQPSQPSNAPPRRNPADNPEGKTRPRTHFVGSAVPMGSGVRSSPNRADTTGPLRQALSRPHCRGSPHISEHPKRATATSCDVRRWWRVSAPSA